MTLAPQANHRGEKLAIGSDMSKRQRKLAGWRVVRVESSTFGAGGGGAARRPGRAAAFDSLAINRGIYLLVRNLSADAAPAHQVAH